MVLAGAGWRHHYGHPRPEVLARYAELDSAIHVTGWGGALRIEHHADGTLAVQEWRQDAGRRWNAPAGG